MESTKGGVEGSHVMRVRVKLALVERYVEVEGGVDGTTSKVFSDNVGVGRHSSILDGDGVQRLERVH